LKQTECERHLFEYEQQLREAFPHFIHLGVTRNGRELSLDVSACEIREIATYVNTQLAGSLISLFACDERIDSGDYIIRYVFCCREKSLLIVLNTPVHPEDSRFISIADLVHAAALYEREIHDLFGLVPFGHPYSKPLVFHGNWPNGNYPLRTDYGKNDKPPFVDGASSFRKISGEGVYEIPVGPVHAGIIEPGHFRFSLAGEPIQNLEAQLYFTHKGIEKLSEGMSFERGFYLAERISGDETFTNSLAYCMAIEQIANIKIPERGEYLRVLFAELERLTCHVGDLVGICLDVAYGFGAFQFRLLRNWCYQLAELLCGSRFLRSVNVPGGIRNDNLNGNESEILQRLADLKRELDDTAEIVRHQTMLTDRIENTGTLSEKIAFDLNAVGPAARASGIPHDIRKTLPYAAYDKLDFDVPVLTGGDVASRMKIKLEECYQSIHLMVQVMESLPHGQARIPVEDLLTSLPAGRSAFGITESPRGENVHWIMTGRDGTIFRYKVRTPSFCNWPVLCYAVSGNIVPDFPLINKSFNLSYAGNDL
jgi:Ni,Fe-hydrogenase III large subunit/Ni,Fe-hydrogenase III component G